MKPTAREAELHGRENIFTEKGTDFLAGKGIYAACPCRLASGEREKDWDILCSCAYRAADVQEYGNCYCNLYVSREWNEGTIPHVYVPERRP